MDGCWSLIPASISWYIAVHTSHDDSFVCLENVIINFQIFWSFNTLKNSNGTRPLSRC